MATPPYVGQPTSALAMVTSEPPPAKVEFVPASPAKRAVWIDGEWTPGRRWTWRAGRWVIPPAGARYSPWTMVRDESGVLYVAPGVWRDAAGNEIAEPAPLATAKGSLSEIIDANGQRDDVGSARHRQGAGDAGAGPHQHDGGAPHDRVSLGGDAGAWPPREEPRDAGAAP